MNLKVNVSTALGATFAWYDFLIFNIAVALVFPKLFFTGMVFLIPLLVFAVGFLARPLGGLIYGIVSDVIGRKQALVSTLYVTGISTVLIGVLPTYEQIGIAAAVLLVILRITQTIAFGGEWAAASTLLAETNNNHPNKGFIASLVSTGWAIASIMAAFSFMIVTSFGDEFFLDYGWRIPFLLSGILLVIGVYIRKRVVESAVFLEFSKNTKEKNRPFKKLITDHRQSLIFGVLAMQLPAAWAYIIPVFGVSFMIHNGLITRPEITEIQFWVAWACLISLLFFGWIGDKVGQKKLFIVNAVFSLVFAFPVFYWILHGHAILALGSLVILMCPGFASAPKFFTSMFPTEIRTVGSGFTYNLGLVIAGCMPLVAQFLVGVTDNLMSVAYVFLMLTVISLISILKINKEYQ
jgi:MHS family shikimate/dehydroshikimate transporter-like MFS transporter